MGIFFLFLRSLKYRWFEYLLASAVVAVLAAVLVVQRSLASYTKDQIHTLAHKLGNNMLVVPGGTNLSDFYTMRYDGTGMPDHYPEKIQASELGKHVGSIQARLYGNVTVREVPVIVVGEKNFRGGSAFSSFPSGKVLLGNAASGRLGIKSSAEGLSSDRLEINGFQVAAQGVSGRPPDGLDMGLFTSLETAQGILNRPGKINAMRLSGCWCSTDIPALAAEVEKLLPGTKAITVAGVMKAQKGVLSTVTRYSAVIHAVVILLIAAIVAILISSQVKRQMREIGLLIATGAPPWLITLLFVAKGGVVGALGGIFGCLMGFPLTKKIASSLIDVALPVSGSLPAIIVPLALLTGVVAAFLPAWRASRLNPIDVLREV